MNEIVRIPRVIEQQQQPRGEVRLVALSFGSHPERPATLVYEESRLLSLVVKPGARTEVSMPFPGGLLDYSQFRIIENTSAVQQPPIEYTILVQQPAVSPLECAITARISGAVEDVNFETAEKIRRSGIQSPLVLMDGGWAIGGFLALGRLAAWRKASTRKAAA